MSAKKPLSVTHPAIARQAAGWDPATVTHGSNKRKIWRCELGHEWETAVYRRTSGNGCPICAGLRVLAGFNDLASINPTLAAQAVGWDPATVTQNSSIKKLWRCELGHEWESTINNRSNGNGCPICAGQRVLPGFNDLAFKNPTLAAQAVGWDPTTVTQGSEGEKVWQCALGHEWKAAVKTRITGKGCPICAGQQVLAGFNDLASKYPAIAAQAVGWDPKTVAVSTHAKKLWRCELGHEWRASVSSRTAPHGCPICSGLQVLPGFNDLAFKNPTLAAQAVGWDPKTVAVSTHAKKLWRCELGHEWEATINSRNDGKGCPICAGQKVLAGFNDLASKYPAIAAQAVGWDPATVTQNSSAKKLWRCVLGHEWRTAVASRSRGNGCPSCSKSGFDPNKEGWLYFLQHEHWGMLQIGITNFPNNRLKDHRGLGWEAVELRGPMDGLIAREWELSILRMLKRNGAHLASAEVAGKFDGYTEAWLRDSLPVTSLRQLMDMVRADE